MIKYYVRWRHVPFYRMFDPLMTISIDHTQIEAPPEATESQIQEAVSSALENLKIRPEEVRIESFQPV